VIKADPQDALVGDRVPQQLCRTLYHPTHVSREEMLLEFAQEGKQVVFTLESLHSVGEAGLELNTAFECCADVLCG
jgi:hypothetical protein